MHKRKLAAGGCGIRGVLISGRGGGFNHLHLKFLYFLGIHLFHPLFLLLGSVITVHTIAFLPIGLMVFHAPIPYLCACPVGPHLLCFLQESSFITIAGGNCLSSRRIERSATVGVSRSTWSFCLRSSVHQYLLLLYTLFIFRTIGSQTSVIYLDSNLAWVDFVGVHFVWYRFPRWRECRWSNIQPWSGYVCIPLIFVEFVLLPLQFAKPFDHIILKIFWKCMYSLWVLSVLCKHWHDCLGKACWLSSTKRWVCHWRCLQSLGQTTETSDL